MGTETDPYELKKPLYLRFPFVLLSVAATFGAGFLLIQWGNSGSTDNSGQKVVLGQNVQPDGIDDAEVQGTVEDCPAPEGPVNVGAANVIRGFTAAAAGSAPEWLVVSEDVERQLNGEDVSPVDRMTRIRGFGEAEGRATSCVLSTWWDGSSLQQSLDLVIVEPFVVDDDEVWRVSSWYRGEPYPAGLTTVASLAYPRRACGDVDELSSVQITSGDPASQITAALEELASGTVGRTVGSPNFVPSDVQVIDVSVDGPRAVVNVTGSDSEMKRCDAQTGFDQIQRTAEEALLSTLPQPEPVVRTGENRSRGGDAVEVQVLVLVDGQEASTLAR